MGLLTNTASLPLSPVHTDFAASTAPEVAMLSDGLAIRVGAHPDDLCLVENLSIGDAIWDLATGRLVDLDGMACTTLDGALLAEMGLRPLPLRTAGGTGWVALASSRVIQREAAPMRNIGAGRVFFRFWPESRLLAEVEGRPVLIRNA